MIVTTEEHGSVPQPELSPQMQQRIAAANAEAQAQCFKLSALMYERLPKELRNLVYSFLCLDDRQIPIGPYYHFRKYEPSGKEREVIYSETQYFPRSGDLETELSDGKVRIDHDIHPQADLLLPSNHIFDPTYMRKEVLLETMKVYYESNSFSVCNIERGLDDLCTAVRLSDGSTVEFVPVDYIRDLQIRIKLEHLHAKPHCLDTRKDLRLKEFVRQESFLRHTVDSLQAFRSRVQAFPPHEMNVEIVLMSDLSGFYHPGIDDRRSAMKRSVITNLLQTIRNLVYELLHEYSYTTARVTHQDDGIFPIPKSYTDKFFALTKEQWDLEKSIQQSTRDWSHDFWLIPISTKELTEENLTELGGYCYDTVDDFMTQRWGWTISEGPYWPVGSPFNVEAAQAYVEREARKYEG